VVHQICGKTLSAGPLPQNIQCHASDRDGGRAGRGRRAWLTHGLYD